MNSLEQVHAVCDSCGTAIQYGNAQVTVTRNVEQVDRSSESPEVSVSVIQSDVLLTLCARCGNRLNHQLLADVLRATVAELEHNESVAVAGAS